MEHSYRIDISRSHSFCLSFCFTEGVRISPLPPAFGHHLLHRDNDRSDVAAPESLRKKVPDTSLNCTKSLTALRTRVAQKRFSEVTKKEASQPVLTHTLLCLMLLRIVLDVRMDTWH